jgi:hypothetical protein
MVQDARGVSIEIHPARGPLDDEQLGWITSLYGVVDPKYASLEFVRHQFVANPFGWTAHIFVLDDGRAVGHCCAVPFRARRGDESLIAGKIEAVVIDPDHRGRRPDGRILATEMLAALYPFGLANGMDILFGLAPPHVARVHVRAGCHEVPPDAPAYTIVADASALAVHEQSWKRRTAVHLLATAQGVTAASAYSFARLATRSGATTLGKPTAADAELAAVEADNDRWTISGADAWDWFAGSGTLEALEIPGASGCRALVRFAKPGTSPAQIVAWRPHRPGLVPALLLLGTTARLARQRGAPTLRFQPWAGAGGDGVLARACSLLGFVRRSEAALVVYSHDPSLDALRLTPFFYVTF